MNTNTIMIVASLALAGLGLPLALKLVPPNPFYGFRTPRTMANRELWFRVNRFAGYSLIAAGGLSALIFLQFPEGALGGVVYRVGAFVVPLLVALAATGVYLKSVSHRNDG